VALRLGDVRKALRLLNSAPISPKTEATVAALRKLHPAGSNPSQCLLMSLPGFLLTSLKRL
jgi:hypothetical protein